MGTISGVGFSENTKSRDAGIAAAGAALSHAGIQSCNLAMLFSTGKCDPMALRDGVRSVIGPQARLIGGYAVGIITADALGYEGNQVGVAVFSSDTMNIDMFARIGLDSGEEAVGAALGRDIKRARFEGEPNVLLMYDSLKWSNSSGFELNMATPLLKGLGETLGHWPPLAGVGMFGDMHWSPTFQWFDNEIHQQSAMALAFSGGGVRMDTIIMHGCKPASSYHTVTRAEKNVVLELDGKPATDAIAELLGAGYGWQDYPLFVTLGENKGDLFGDFKEDDYANHLCMAVDRERGGLVMFEPNLVPGSKVQLMRRSVDFDYVKARAEELLNRVGDRKPFFALYIDCAGRASAYSGASREEADEVRKVIAPRMPFLGMYSGVEIARVGRGIESLDWTGVLCIFSE